MAKNGIGERTIAVNIAVPEKVYNDFKAKQRELGFSNREMMESFVYGVVYGITDISEYMPAMKVIAQMTAIRTPDGQRIIPDSSIRAVLEQQGLSIPPWFRDESGEDSEDSEEYEE